MILSRCARFTQPALGVGDAGKKAEKDRSKVSFAPCLGVCITLRGSCTYVQVYVTGHLRANLSDLDAVTKSVFRYKVPLAKLQSLSPHPWPALQSRSSGSLGLDCSFVVLSGEAAAYVDMSLKKKMAGKWVAEWPCMVTLHSYCQH